MKKVMLMLMAVCCLTTYGQKKKPVKGKNTVAVSSSKKLVLGKVGEVSAEQLEKKNGILFYAMSGKDTLFSKPISKNDGVPTGLKITPVTASGAKLHALTWTQQKKAGDPKTKIENITETHTEIWDASAKKRVFENTNLVNNITEIVWLDPNKTASKTVDKIRREGLECIVTPQGDIVLKSKTQESKYVYDAAQQKFVAKK